MSNPIVSKKKAQSLAFALFLIGIGVLFFVGTWWPGIALVIGLPLAIKHYLLGKHWDMVISLFVFIGIFVTVQFQIEWDFLLPVLFILGGLYIFLKEFFMKDPESEVESEEDIKHEIEEDKK